MSLKERLQNYLHKVWSKDRDMWVSKGFLETLAKEAGYLGDNAGRRLRELVEEGKIEHRPKGISQEYRYIPEITEIAQITDKLSVDRNNI